MNKINLCLLLLLVFGLQYSCVAQKDVIKDNPYSLISGGNGVKDYNHAIAISEKGNAYQFMGLRRYLGANNALVEKANEKSAINFQWRLIENLINSARVSRQISNNKSPFKDKYKTWITLSKTTMYGKEAQLYEGYSFFYIAQFLYYTKKNGWNSANSQNSDRWNAALGFVETNVWTKWYERSMNTYGQPYRNFLWTRTHMGAHWAGVAMYLGMLTNDKRIKEQCSNYLRQYDTLLKRNFKNKGLGYIWNSTYDDVKGTDGGVSKTSIVQDVSHGNHVISYIVAAYESGSKNWTLNDLRKLSYTFSNIIYNKNSNKFSDNVDGSNIKSGIKGGENNGDFIGDGWIKLSKYDQNVKSIISRFISNKDVKKYNQEIQLKANF
ncbi:hypothetical protein [Sphingobacterium sp.]|uniref:hypothetical protein n=1 Tax=Sphingobacterium sp. TaxID=341027 RepID=UPI0031DAD5BA